MVESTHPGSDPRELRTVTDLVERRAESMGAEPLLWYRDDTYSYEEIDAQASAVAGGLAAAGVEQGDTVCTFMYNSPEHLAVWFGLAKLGAIMVPVNVNLKADGLSYIINDSNADVVVLDSDTIDNYETTRNDLDGITHEFLLSEGEHPDYTPFDRLRGGDPVERSAVTVDETDPMCIIYTSGTTGMPKGVVLPHYSYINTGWEYVDILDLDETDRLFTTLPLFHCNAQQLTVMGAMLAGTDFAMERWFSASNYWDQIRTYDATVFNYLGTMIQVLLSQDDVDENPAVYGFGAAAPEDLVPEFEERFEVKLVEGYGLTETGTLAIFNRPGEGNATRKGSIGRPVSYAEVEVVDERDNPVEPGEHGELVVRPTRSNTMMKEYYQKSDQTVEDWQNLWFHTGDIGYRDETGLYYFVDRKAYSLRRRGENISSFEVEQVLDDHPDVQESAVVGVPSELGEEDVKAYLLPAAGADIDELDIVQWCEDRLAYFKVPRYVETVEELPKTATERTEKYKLKEQGVGDAWDREEVGYELDR